VKGERPKAVHVVRVGPVPTKLWCLALQDNLGTTQGIVSHNEVEGMCGDDPTPNQAMQIAPEEIEEAPDTILLQDG
jgi:hypothetical protein